MWSRCLLLYLYAKNAMKPFRRWEGRLYSACLMLSLQSPYYNFRYVCVVLLRLVNIQKPIKYKLLPFYHFNHETSCSAVKIIPYSTLQRQKHLKVIFGFKKVGFFFYVQHLHYVSQFIIFRKLMKKLTELFVLLIYRMWQNMYKLY